MNGVITQHIAWGLRLKKLSHTLIKCKIIEYLDIMNGEVRKTHTAPYSHRSYILRMGATDNI